MGRPRSGTLLRCADGSFKGRLCLKDGTKSERFDVPAGSTEKQARAYVTAAQAHEDREHTLYLARRKAEPKPAGETCDAWFERYLPTMEAGAGHRRVSASAWKVWISPVIGKDAIGTLTRDRVEDVRDRLDLALSEGTIAPSTAANVWSVLTAALKMAAASKTRSLRVHAAPIHTGILAPRGGQDRARPWLYPSEWLRLAACEEVPIEWREVYAIALYTGLRPNELRVLRWSDVDRVGLIHVTKAWDPEERVVKEPKTAEGRRVVPVRPELAPLLDEMRGRPSDLVVPIVWKDAAKKLRRNLRRAGVHRPRLFTRSKVEEDVDFRSLRDTYATWSALAGVDPLRLRREMGHESLETTDRYVKEASAHAPALIGAPFPAFRLDQDSDQDAKSIERSGSDCRTRTYVGGGGGAKERGNVPPFAVEGGRSGPDSVRFGPGFGPADLTGHAIEIGLYSILEKAEAEGAWPMPGGDA